MFEYTQKQVAAILDCAAARAHSVNRTPASGKQCWFLAKLLIEDCVRRGRTELDSFVTSTSFVLTVKEASTLIDSCLKSA